VLPVQPSVMIRLAAAVTAAVAMVVPNPARAGASPPNPSAQEQSAAARLVAWDGAETGRDVSFPQCGGSLPDESVAMFGVLGTNDGRAFTKNPCLVAELRWAKRLARPPAFYANTGNPGPVRARNWPVGQTEPKTCPATDANSLACSYDYGWNAAWASYSAATDAAQRLHHVDRSNARRRAANVDWWLDVETMNSWQTVDDTPSATTARRDVATIAGEIDALRTAGVHSVGVYSTAFQWNVITGGARVTGSTFSEVPQWLAGYDSQSDALAGCSESAFTGGAVRMTQYLGHDGFDADVVCAGSGS